jgi:hypothetical protein
MVLNDPNSLLLPLLWRRLSAIWHICIEALKTIDISARRFCFVVCPCKAQINGKYLEDKKSG